MQVIESGEEGGLFRIGVATLTGVLAFLVLEKVFLKSSNSPLFPFLGKPPRKLLLHQGLGDEQPRDEPGAPREGEQEDRRLPQLARQLHRQPIAWACGLIASIIITFIVITATIPVTIVSMVGG